MTEGTSNTSIVKLGAGSIARYSNSLVRRAVEEISLSLPETLRSVSQTKTILIIGAEVGESLVQILPSQGYQAKFVPSEGYDTIWLQSDSILPRTDIYSELSNGKYKMVLVAYWRSFETLLEIRRRFPNIKTIFLNTSKQEWDEIAKREGVDAVFRPPDFEYDQLLDTINELILR
jgi:hypothetical protein